MKRYFPFFRHSSCGGIETLSLPWEPKGHHPRRLKTSPPRLSSSLAARDLLRFQRPSPGASLWVTESAVVQVPSERQGRRLTVPVSRGEGQPSPFARGLVPFRLLSCRPPRAQGGHAEALAPPLLTPSLLLFLILPARSSRAARARLN